LVIRNRVLNVIQPRRRYSKARPALFGACVARSRCTCKMGTALHVGPRRGETNMTDTSRRTFLGALAFTAGVLAPSQSLPLSNDGHAAGYDVAPASDYVPLIPRRTGEPMKFTASLDKSAIKATSGGWARDITSRGLSIATDIAGAHLYLNPGGVREMHWHNSA